MSFRVRRAAVLTVLCAGVAARSEAAVAVDYNSFPPSLQTILDQRIAQLSAGGGICLAGRVVKSDGAGIHYASDAQVNLYQVVDEPTRMYEGGWFIMDRTLGPYNAGANRLVVVRAFGYDPIDAQVTILSAQVTYLDFTLVRTPPDEIASIEGTVRDENDEPFFGARVSLRFPFSNFGYNQSGYSYPHMEFITGATGQYIFQGLSSTKHTVVASSQGYAYHLENVTPLMGESRTQGLQLFPNRTVHLRYVYQADGSRDFIAGDLHTGTLNWTNGSGGADFSQGRIEGYEPNDLRDLEMLQTRDAMRFYVVYSNGHNGFYDAGAVDFDALTMAASSGYVSNQLPVVVGHTYVVRTYEEDHYVKFIVESDESSFRTVTPGDPPAIYFAGYDLTIDFSYASGNGQINVDTWIAPPSQTGYPCLPSYWTLSGMTGLAFSYDADFGYKDSDLIARRIPESGLSVLRSTNNGVSWQQLPAIQDSASNTLRVEGLTLLGRFTIANTSDFLRGDTDGDGDMDLHDFAAMQRCFAGAVRQVSNAECVLAMIDADLDVDSGDLAEFVTCMSGPVSPVADGCGL